VVARRHLTPYSNSSSSIFSILTGRYPYADAQNVVRSDPHLRVDSFVSVAKADGYRTAAFASIDGDYDRMDTFLRAHGFDEVGDRESLRLRPLENREFGSDWDLAARYLSWLDRDARRPALAMLLPSNSHWPFFFSPQSRIASGDSRLARYRNAIREQDRILGAIIDGLRSRGRLDRTIIVLAPDHGSYFGLTSETLSNDPLLATYHVPVFISHPRLRAETSTLLLEDATSHVDLAPTLQEMISMRRPPADVQGRSWLRPIPERLIFMIDPTAQTVAATEGDLIVLRSRDRSEGRARRWVSGDAGRPATTSRADLYQRRIELFERYQFHYLRGLSARNR
jgi:arylsulfatase A-like enzyme